MIILYILIINTNIKVYRFLVEGVVKVGRQGAAVSSKKVTQYQLLVVSALYRNKFRINKNILIFTVRTFLNRNIKISNIIYEMTRHMKRK